MKAHFAADWLSLREPADHLARNRPLAARLQDHFADSVSLRIVDLGAGTGSNLRYLAPWLPERQHWTLIDHDPSLLARVETSSGTDVRVLCADLRDWRTRLAGPLPDLVTAAALLDLVSAEWLRELVWSCRELGAVGCFALSYDGRILWSRSDPDDAMVTAAVNMHQKRDKGFGAALGPDAANTAAALFATAGFRVHTAVSDWDLGGERGRLAEALLEGWVGAACEQAPQARDRILDWGERRRKDLERGVTRVRVGHLDLLALPPAAA